MNSTFNEVNLGILESIIEIDDVRDISCNPDGSIYVTSNTKGNYRHHETINELEVVRIANQIANKMEKEFNPSNPFLEGEIDKKDFVIRVSVFHKHLTNNTALTLRKVTKNNILTTKGMIESNYATNEVLELLKRYVEAGVNILVIGETGSGKTQLVKWMANYIPNNQRIITVEDSMEFQLPLLYPHKNVLEVRVKGGLTYSNVIAKCLRQNLQWLLLQEAREVEVDDLLDGMSNGCKVITTMHADETVGITTRILQMLKLDSSSYDSLNNRIHSLIDVVICIKKTDDNGIRRFISSIVELDYTNLKASDYVVYKQGDSLKEHSPKLKGKLCKVI